MGSPRRSRSESPSAQESSGPGRTRKSLFLFRHLSDGSKRKEAKQQEGQGDSIEKVFVQPPKHKKGDNFYSNANKNEEISVSLISSAKTNISASKRRRRRTSSIKILKRALSSPPFLLKRLYSRNHSSSDNNSKASFDKDTSEGSCHDIDGDGASIIHNGSSISSSLELNLTKKQFPRCNDHACNNSNMTGRTNVVSGSYLPLKQTNNQDQQSEPNGDEQKLNEEITANTINCATSILHHSYLLESICGVPSITNNNDKNIFEKSNNKLLRSGIDHNENGYQHQKKQHYRSVSISEDPTVQESIECIFASQLEDGLKLWDDVDDFDNNNIRLTESSERRLNIGNDLISPADLQQSRMNRKNRRDSTKSIFSNMSQTKKRYEQASLVYVGTFDPSCPTPRNVIYENTEESNAGGINNNLPSDPLPCRCATSSLPAIEPENWPQAPIALRPTPGSNTFVKAIRFSNSNEPLWVPGSRLTWSQRLAQHWGKYDDEKQQQVPHYTCCGKCVVLPINNGNEKPGESLIVDFESDLFEGSLLLRLRYVEGVTPEPYNDNKGYFKGINRRYQACIRGRFKKSIPVTELVTGLRFDRKFGRLPSKWILKGALKVISFFAPQLDTKLDIDRPASLSPLGSTPQSIIVDDDCRRSSNNNEADGTATERNSIMNPLEDVRIEPSEAHRSILGESFKGETSLQRAKMRKKTFDKLYVQKTAEPKTDPSKIYTFEFLQHLFNFQDFSIDLVSMLGSVNLEDMLDGQPLQIMAAHGDQPLWSFDVWHECLWEQAKFHDDLQRSSK